MAGEGGRLRAAAAQERREQCRAQGPRCRPSSHRPRAGQPGAQDASTHLSRSRSHQPYVTRCILIHPLSTTFFSTHHLFVIV